MCSECAGAPWSSAFSACDLFPAHPFCPAGLPRTDEAPHLKAPSVIVSHGLQANSQDKIEEALSWEMLLGSKEKQSSPRRERNSFRLGRALRCGAWLLRGCARWCLATEGLLRLVPGTDGRNSAASRSCVLSAPGDGLSREVCRRGTNVQVLPGDSVRLVCPRRCIGKGTPRPPPPRHSQQRGAVITRRRSHCPLWSRALPRPQEEGWLRRQKRRWREEANRRSHFERNPPKLLFAGRIRYLYR